MRRGYFVDDFLPFFVHERASKKPPLINRGVYTRIAAIWHVIDRFLAAFPASTLQLLNLGAGYDTTHFVRSASCTAWSRVTTFEVDVLPVCRAKARAIEKEPRMRSLLASPTFNAREGEVRSARYQLFACDLRDTRALQDMLTARGFDSNAPTLALSECVLCYIPPASSAALLAWLGSLPSSCIAIYEMIKPHDAFGRVMLENLAARGVLLPSIHAYPTLDAQRARLRDAGFSRAEALDLNAVWRQVLAADDRRRLQMLEPLDELEELELLQAHYCFVLGVKGEWAEMTIGDTAGQR